MSTQTQITKGDQVFFGADTETDVPTVQTKNRLRRGPSEKARAVGKAGTKRPKRIGGMKVIKGRMSNKNKGGKPS